MGLNISLYKLHVLAGPYHEQRVEWFDSIRYAGDREFDSEVEKEFHDEGEFWRPINLDDAKKWVDQNVPPENKRRLLVAIEHLQRDTDLWFYSSY